jgi:hypothetical protein
MSHRTNPLSQLRRTPLIVTHKGRVRPPTFGMLCLRSFYASNPRPAFFSPFSLKESLRSLRLCGSSSSFKVGVTPPHALDSLVQPAPPLVATGDHIGGRIGHADHLQRKRRRHRAIARRLSQIARFQPADQERPAVCITRAGLIHDLRHRHPGTGPGDPPPARQPAIPLRPYAAPRSARHRRASHPPAPPDQ